MPAHRFCDACRAFLRGDRRQSDAADSGRNARCVHHSTAASFQAALQLKCALCVRLWAAFRSDSARLIDKQKAGADEGPALDSTTFRGPWTSGTLWRWIFEFYCGNYECRIFLQSSSADLKAAYYPPVGTQPAIGPDTASSQNTGDGIAIGYLQDQLQQCLQHHTSCPSSTHDQAFVPTRLLDVGCATDANVHIRNDTSCLTGTSYVVLSHCWGKLQSTTLSKSSMKSLKDGIPITSLTKTFQDAIAVTRKLQHRYLWIDSLCIVQDDLDDWRAESATMHQVYSNAIFCIAATAAPDGNTGLFFDRDLETLKPIETEITWPPSSFDTNGTKVPASTYWVGAITVSRILAIEQAPLNQRAWVVQERFLSRRVLHFAREMLFWECRESFTSETHPGGHPKDRPRHFFGDALALKTSFDQTRSDRAAPSVNCVKSVSLDLDSTDVSDVYMEWCRFRTFYTKCYMTNGDDVLVALDGISRKVAAVLQDEMVAGLWRNNLINELCWYIPNISAEPRRPNYLHGPSWSWVSSTLPIIDNDTRYAGKNETRSLAVVSTTLVDLSSSGTFARASIVVQCRIMPVCFRSGDRPSIATITSPIGRPPCSIMIYTDEPAPTDECSDAGVDAYVLLLRHGTAKSRTEVDGIVIVPSKDRPGVYSRLGYCTSSQWGAPVSAILDVFNSTEEFSIKIV